MGGLFSRASPPPLPVLQKSFSREDSSGASSLHADQTLAETSERTCTTATTVTEDEAVAPHSPPHAHRPPPTAAMTADTQSPSSNMNSPSLVRLEQQPTPSSSPYFKRSGDTEEPMEIDPKRALMGWVLASIYSLADDVGQFYSFGDCIGRGHDAVVFRCTVVTEAPAPAPPKASGAGGAAAASTDLGTDVAMKVLRKPRLMTRGARKMHKLRGELAIWQKLHHPNLLELFKVRAAANCACVNTVWRGPRASPLARCADARLCLGLCLGLAPRRSSSSRITCASRAS